MICVDDCIIKQIENMLHNFIWNNNVQNTKKKVHQSHRLNVDEWE